MVSTQCRKNETASKLTVERARLLARAIMKIKRSVLARGLCRRVNASTERGGYRLVAARVSTLAMLIAMQCTSAQTPTPLPSSTPTDPASEPVVLAVAKVMPAVVNINAERVVRRQIRDPFEDFATEFLDRKSTRLNSSHVEISYAVFCLKKKKK